MEHKVLIQVLVLISAYGSYDCFKCPVVDDLNGCLCIKSKESLKCQNGKLLPSLSEPIIFKSVTIENFELEKFDESVLQKIKTEELYIRNNSKLTQINSNIFSKMAKIIVIENNVNLKGDDLFKLIPKSEDIEVLEIRKSKITAIPPNAFEKLRNIKKIYLQNNDISEIGSQAFNNLNELEVINLEDNQIIKLNPKSLQVSSQSVVIYLDGNRIDSNILKEANVTQNANQITIQLARNPFKKFPEFPFRGICTNQNINMSFGGNEIECLWMDIKWILNSGDLCKRIDGLRCKNILGHNLFSITENEIPDKPIEATTPGTTKETTKSGSTKVNTKPSPTNTKVNTTSNDPTPKTTVSSKINSTPDIQKTTPITLKTSRTPITEQTETTKKYLQTCSPPEDITPCFCDRSSLSIECLGPDVDNINISKIGHKLQSSSSKFESIRISATSLTQIPKFLFIKVNFNKILIEGNEKLEQIDNQVFAKSRTDLFIVRNNPKLSNCEVFDLAKNLDPLEVILSGNALKEVPENALIDEENPINERLSRISLDHNNIEVITSNAFTGLKNLSYLSLDHNFITTIEDYGLKIYSVSSHLKILLNNNKLNSMSFTIRSIEIPEKTILNMNLAENQLTLLSENIFKNFLNRNNSELNLHGNKFICDCNTKWLLNKTLSKNALNIFCDNKQQSFLDLNEFDLYCSKSSKSTN